MVHFITLNSCIPYTTTLSFPHTSVLSFFPLPQSTIPFAHLTLTYKGTSMVYLSNTTTHFNSLYHLIQYHQQLHPLSSLQQTNVVTPLSQSTRFQGLAWEVAKYSTTFFSHFCNKSSDFSESDYQIPGAIELDFFSDSQYQGLDTQPKPNYVCISGAIIDASSKQNSTWKFI